MAGLLIGSPCCPRHFGKQKIGDFLKIKLKETSIKHPEDNVWYDSRIPIYTCEGCGKQYAIERVNKT